MTGETRPTSARSLQKVSAPQSESDPFSDLTHEAELDKTQECSWVSFSFDEESQTGMRWLLAHTWKTRCAATLVLYLRLTGLSFSAHRFSGEAANGSSAFPSVWSSHSSFVLHFLSVSSLLSCRSSFTKHLQTRAVHLGDLHPVPVRLSLGVVSAQTRTWPGGSWAGTSQGKFPRDFPCPRKDMVGLQWAHGEDREEKQH